MLNEGERRAKRALIEHNRERKELLQQLEKIRKATPTRNMSEFQPLVQRVTAEYCKHIDVPLKLCADFRFEDPAEQFRKLVSEIFLSRTLSFANSMEFFQEVTTEFFH